MKTVNYVPSCCKGSDATHEGSVTIRLPTFDEKFDYLEQIQTSVKENGDIETNQMQKLRSIRAMVKLSKAHYVEVCLKNKATGEEVKSFEEMQYCDDLHTVLMEVAGHLVNGFKVGNG